MFARLNPISQFHHRPGTQWQFCMHRSPQLCPSCQAHSPENSLDSHIHAIHHKMATLYVSSTVDFRLVVFIVWGLLGNRSGAVMLRKPDGDVCVCDFV
jgi:hypothetical protein